MAGGINVGRWLRRVVFNGKPVTAGNLYDLLAIIRSDTAVKESLEAKIKHEIALVLDLDAAAVEKLKDWQL